MLHNLLIPVTSDINSSAAHLLNHCTDLSYPPLIPHHSLYMHLTSLPTRPHLHTPMISPHSLNTHLNQAYSVKSLYDPLRATSFNAFMLASFAYAAVVNCALLTYSLLTLANTSFVTLVPSHPIDSLHLSCSDTSRIHLSCNSQTPHLLPNSVHPINHSNYHSYLPTILPHS